MRLSLIVAVAAASTSGCSRREPRSEPPPVLANGIPRALAPGLSWWTTAWRRAVPGFRLDSLSREGESALVFQYSRPYDPGDPDSRRRRDLFGEYSPDSTRLVDPDIYSDLIEGEIGREPDSAPALIDLARDSLWVLDFCGTPCHFDGACWLDESRFALVGATRSGPQADGPWRGFLDLYDLRARRIERWLTRLVDDAAHLRVSAARDSALFARLRSRPV